MVAAGTTSRDEEKLTVHVDGIPMEARRGDTVAHVLLGAGRIGFRRTEVTGGLRGVFCGMGMCYDCLVHVRDRGLVRACMVAVTDGMEVTTSGREGA